jgi:hypothetical protein
MVEFENMKQRTEAIAKALSCTKVRIVEKDGLAWTKSHPSEDWDGFRCYVEMRVVLKDHAKKDDPNLERALREMTETNMCLRKTIAELKAKLENRVVKLSVPEGVRYEVDHGAP